MSSLVEYSSAVFSRRLKNSILLLPIFVGFIGFSSLLNEWLSTLINGYISLYSSTNSHRDASTITGG